MIKPGYGGYGVKIKDLLTGEMFMGLMDQDAFLLHGPYWKVVGHKHEEKIVLVEDIRTGVKGGLPYDTSVRVRPFAYKFIRPECRKEWIYYLEWPYDEEGHVCDPPRDYTQWEDEPDKKEQL